MSVYQRSVLHHCADCHANLMHVRVIAVALQYMVLFEIPYATILILWKCLEFCSEIATLLFPA